MKPLVDFNIRTSSDFVARLLPQGAWARCAACNKVRHGLLGADHFHLVGDNAVNVARRTMASAAMHKCARCSQTKPKSEYWAADWKNKHQGISCTECEIRPPADRPRSTHQALGVRVQAMRNNEASQRVLAPRHRASRAGGGLQGLPPDPAKPETQLRG